MFLPEFSSALGRDVSSPIGFIEQSQKRCSSPRQERNVNAEPTALAKVHCAPDGALEVAAGAAIHISPPRANTMHQFQ
jgi:hypothetical protein